jgi:glycosyltransferase involved in cell wall biosynthesis
VNELISVIVPIYKVEQYLPKCVESIRNQIYQNLEIILVDDGSPDHCPELCDEYAGLDSRIRVIHKPNGGLSDARNAGIEAAEGDYICFVDSDDYIAETMIQKLYSALKKQDADMSLCGFTYVDEKYNSIVERNIGMPIKNEVLFGRDAIKKMAGESGWVYTIAWCKLYKAALFQTIRFPVGKIHEDEFVSHLVFAKCNKVSCIADRLYFYLQRENSIMGNAHKSFSIKELDASEAFLKRALFLKSIDKHEFHEAIGINYFYAISNFSDMYSYGRKFSSDERERLKEMHRLLRENIHMGKGCSLKNKVHIILACISPKLHNFVVKKGRVIRFILLSHKS